MFNLFFLILWLDYQNKIINKKLKNIAIIGLIHLKPKPLSTKANLGFVPFHKIKNIHQLKLLNN